MVNVAIVTGAGSGIGRATARKLLDSGHSVIGVGRRRLEVEETGDGYSGYQPIVADLAEEEGRAAVADAAGSLPVGYVIHNAGRLEPVGDMATVSRDEWRQTMAVNVEAPLFLTQALIPLFANAARVLHISSGAAHRLIRGWGVYCVTKASAHMLYRLLADELAERGIAVGSMRPGVVDTPMQSYIRDLAPQQFPDVERFRDLKRNGDLVAPDDVAHFAYRLLVDIGADRFSKGEWDIREHWGEVI